MDRHLAAVVRAHRSLHDQAAGSNVERPPLHHRNLPNREPLACLKVRHDPVTIDHFQEEPSARLEHRSGGANYQPVVRCVGEVPEAGEEIEDEVEVVANSRLSHVAEAPVNTDAGLASPGFRDLEEIR